MANEDNDKVNTEEEVDEELVEDEEAESEDEEEIESEDDMEPAPVEVEQYLPPLEWETEEFRHSEKGLDWYIALGVIAVAGATATVIFGDLMFAALIIVAAATLALYASRRPNTITVSMDDGGITIDNRYFPFSTLESFWIEEEMEFEQPVLLVKSQRLLMPLVTVWIDDEEVDPSEVREHLLQFMDEEEMSEPLSQRAMEWIGF